MIRQRSIACQVMKQNFKKIDITFPLNLSKKKVK